MKVPCTVIGAMFVLSASGSQAALAQRMPVETVPKEIVAILLRDAPSDGLDLRVGGPPADFPKDLLPPRTEVALTAVSNRGTTVVGIATRLLPADRSRLETTLAGAGWTSPTPRPRGFTMSSDEAPLSICRGTDFASLDLLPRPKGGSYVRATTTKDPQRSCQPQPDSPFADVTIPALTPPPNAIGHGGGIGGGMDSVQSLMRLDTKLSLEKLAAHYVRQLTVAGWRAEDPSIEVDGLSATRLNTKSRTGDLITAMLIISAGDGTLVDLKLLLVRGEARRRMGG